MRTSSTLAPAICLVAVISAGCGVAGAEPPPDDRFAIEPHPLVPVFDGQVATGPPTAQVLEQPIAFPHYTHAYTLQMDCQYCHSAARRSIHSGVPPTQSCMGCHKFAMRDRPEIVKLAAMWDSGQPIRWQKVHDLPDYVYFSHKRHVRGGLDCTECHGQVMLQGQPPGTAAPTAEAPGTTPAPMAVMIREATLQMGWCLDCHATHPSIDQNYGKDAELRRAELKDCWTCHK